MTLPQWPDEELLPDFKQTFLQYLSQIQSLSYKFVGLVAEAFELPPDGLAHFFDTDDLMQHRAKVRPVSRCGCFLFSALHSRL